MRSHMRTHCRIEVHIRLLTQHSPTQELKRSTSWWTQGYGTIVTWHPQEALLVAAPAALAALSSHGPLGASDNRLPVSVFRFLGGLSMCDAACAGLGPLLAPAVAALLATEGPDMEVPSLLPCLCW